MDLSRIGLHKLRSVVAYLQDLDALRLRLALPEFNWGIYRTLKGLRWQGYDFDSILDIGASTGQFALTASDIFRRAKVHAFEPLQSSREVLVARVKGVRGQRVRVWAQALGPRAQQGLIHVSGYSPSSSILPMLPTHVEAFPGTEALRDEKLEIVSLDSLTEELAVGGQCLIKIDVQGYEMEVLRGGQQTLKHARIIIVEASLVPLYAGAPIFDDIMSYLRAAGFRFIGIGSVLCHPSTRRTLQIDAVFERIAGSAQA